MMDAMGHDQPQREGVPDRCSECGVAAAAIVDWSAHTAWHAGTEAPDGAVIVAFLEGVDPALLEQAVLELDADQPIAAALTVLKQLAVGAA